MLKDTRLRGCKSHVSYHGKVPHLCQVSPGRGSGAQPDGAETRSWPHDSCTRPPRSHSPQRSPLTGSREGHHKSLRVGIFLGTLPHLTAGILEADELPCSYSGLWKSADLEEELKQRRWVYTSHRHSHHSLGRSCALLWGLFWRAQWALRAGAYLSHVQHFAVVGCLRACFQSALSPPFLFTSATVCAPN